MLQIIQMAKLPLDVNCINSVNDNPTAADNFVFDFEGNILRIDQGNIGYADVDNDNFDSLTIQTSMHQLTLVLNSKNVMLIYDATTPNGETLIDNWNC